MQVPRAHELLAGQEAPGVLAQARPFFLGEVVEPHDASEDLTPEFVRDGLRSGVTEQPAKKIEHSVAVTYRSASVTTIVVPRTHVDAR